MPAGWVHATIDLITFGRHFFDLHKEKDEAWKRLGPDHRVVDHEWYQAYGKSWTFDDPFPDWLKQLVQAVRDTEGEDQAERHMSWIVHDYFDRVWDGLSEDRRRYREGFFAWVLFHPEILKGKFGVDVLNGKIHRVIEGRETWEDCPFARTEYRRLRSYAEAVSRRHQAVREMLECYG